MLIDTLFIIFMIICIYINFFFSSNFYSFITLMYFMDFYYFIIMSFMIFMMFMYENNFFFFFLFKNYVNFNFYNYDFFLFYFDEMSQNSFLLSLFMSVFFFFILMLNKPFSVMKNILLNIFLMIFLSFIFMFTNSMFMLFLSFELLLLVSLNLLKLTSKSESMLEAVGEMFFWTLFGSFFLLLSIFMMFNFFNPFLDFFLYDNFLSNLLSFFMLIGFGVKMPMWPCLSWLLKAHVEASVEFSILLSGFMVKLGMLGLMSMFENFSNNYILYLLMALCMLAMFDATLSLFAQQDLKSIVALTTMIEMNWLILCFTLGDQQNLFLANYLIMIHTFSTTSEFLLVESLSKSFNTSDMLLMGSLWYNSPNLWYISFFIVFITIGFPGTSMFLAKFLFMPFLLNYSIMLFLFFLMIFFFILPVFFMKIWLPLWFGLYYKYGLSMHDLSKKEYFMFFISIFFSMLLGLFPNFFMFLLL